MIDPNLTPEDIKWLELVREHELHNRKHRPLPTLMLVRLKGFGLIELRHRQLVLTRAGEQALQAARQG